MIGKLIHRWKCRKFPRRSSLDEVINTYAEPAAPVEPPAPPSPSPAMQLKPCLDWAPPIIPLDAKLTNNLCFMSDCGLYRIFWNGEKRTAEYTHVDTGVKRWARWTLDEVESFINEGIWLLQ